MKSHCLLSLIPFLSLTLFSCSSSSKTTKKMLEDHEFSESINEHYELRLTMNDDHTYEYAYKVPVTANYEGIDIQIKDKWEHVLSFHYSYSFDDWIFLNKVEGKMKGHVGIFKLNNNIDHRGLQNYLVLHISTYHLWSTEHEITREYLESLRGKGYSGSNDNNGRIEFWGPSLYPRGYAMAKWKK